MHELWETHGPRLVSVMAKKSYQIGSDFSYRNAPEERRERMSGAAYIVFSNALRSYNPRSGVPFGAYLIQKGKWYVTDEKCVNSERSAHERPLSEASSCTYMPDFVEKCLWKDTLQRMYKATKNNPRLHKYFGTCLEMLNEGYEYNDAEVARRMGCSRVNVGQCKKAFVTMMKNDTRFRDVVPFRHKQ